jgi:hypothetical protein
MSMYDHSTMSLLSDGGCSRLRLRVRVGLLASPSSVRPNLFSGD